MVSSARLLRVCGLIREERGREISCEVAMKTMTEETSEEDKVKFLPKVAIMGQFKQASNHIVHMQ